MSGQNTQNTQKVHKVLVIQQVNITNFPLVYRIRIIGKSTNIFRGFDIVLLFCLHLEYPKKTKHWQRPLNSISAFRNRGQCTLFYSIKSKQKISEDRKYVLSLLARCPQLTCFHFQHFNYLT